MPPSEYPATTAIKVLTLSIWPPWLHRPIPSWLIFDRNIKSGIIDFFPTLAGARCDCARTLSSLYIVVAKFPGRSSRETETGNGKRGCQKVGNGEGILLSNVLFDKETRSERFGDDVPGTIRWIKSSEQYLAIAPCKSKAYPKALPVHSPQDTAGSKNNFSLSFAQRWGHWHIAAAGSLVAGASPRQPRPGSLCHARRRTAEASPSLPHYLSLAAWPSRRRRILSSSAAPPDTSCRREAAGGRSLRFFDYGGGPQTL
jgi:hypothetical protein